MNALEQTLEGKLTLKNQWEVNIYGNIDRIDDVNGKIRVVDYKSGNVQASDLSVKTIPDLLKKPKAFQLMIYAWLYYKNSVLVPVSAGNISFQNMKEFFLPVKIAGSEILNQAVLEEFESILKVLLEDMLSAENVFVHAEESTKVKYCEYCV